MPVNATERVGHAAVASESAGEGWSEVIVPTVHPMRQSLFVPRSFPFHETRWLSIFGAVLFCISVSMHCGVHLHSSIF